MLALHPSEHEIRIAGKDMMKNCRARNPHLGADAFHLHDFDIFEPCMEEPGRIRVRHEVEAWCRDHLAGAFSLAEAVFVTGGADGRNYALFVGSFASDADATLFAFRWR